MQNRSWNRLSPSWDFPASADEVEEGEEEEAAGERHPMLLEWRRLQDLVAEVVEQLPVLAVLPRPYRTMVEGAIPESHQRACYSPVEIASDPDLAAPALRNSLEADHLHRR